MKLLRRTEIVKPDIVYNLEVKNNHNYIANGVVISNCHGSKSKVLHDMITNYGNNCVHRYGLTGTMPKDECSELMVKVALGEIKYECYAKDLIETGELSKPYIKVVQLDDVKYLKDSGITNISHMMHEEEEYFLSSNKSRMRCIADMIIENIEHSEDGKGNTLVLVNKVKYGQELSKMIPNSYCLSGKDKVDTRKEVYNKFENNNNIVAICTRQIASVGLSIDRIHHLVFLDYNKSFISTIQTIGRGLRKAHDKTDVLVLDICSNLSSSSKRMNTRIKHYKEAEYEYKKLKKTYTTIDE